MYIKNDLKRYQEKKLSCTSVSLVHCKEYWCAPVECRFERRDKSISIPWSGYATSTRLMHKHCWNLGMEILWAKLCLIVPVDIMLKCDAWNKLKTEIKSCSLELKVAVLSFHIKLDHFLLMKKWYRYLKMCYNSARAQVYSIHMRLHQGPSD